MPFQFMFLLKRLHKRKDFSGSPRHDSDEHATSPDANNVEEVEECTENRRGLLQQKLGAAFCRCVKWATLTRKKVHESKSGRYLLRTRIRIGNGKCTAVSQQPILAQTVSDISSKGSQQSKEFERIGKSRKGSAAEQSQLPAPGFRRGCSPKNDDLIGFLDGTEDFYGKYSAEDPEARSESSAAHGSLLGSSATGPSLPGGRQRIEDLPERPVSRLGFYEDEEQQHQFDDEGKAGEHATRPNTAGNGICRARPSLQVKAVLRDARDILLRRPSLPVSHAKVLPSHSSATGTSSTTPLTSPEESPPTPNRRVLPSPQSRPCSTLTRTLAQAEVLNLDKRVPFPSHPAFCRLELIRLALSLTSHDPIATTTSYSPDTQPASLVRSLLLLATLIPKLRLRHAIGLRSPFLARLACSIDFSPLSDPSFPACLPAPVPYLNIITSWATGTSTAQPVLLGLDLNVPSADQRLSRLDRLAVLRKWVSEKKSREENGAGMPKWSIHCFWGPGPGHSPLRIATMLASCEDGS
jgi:hypothetical protein